MLAEPPRLLHSIREARELLGDMPERTFARLLCRGDLETVMIGARRRFVTHDTLLSYIARLRAEAGHNEKGRAAVLVGVDTITPTKSETVATSSATAPAEAQRVSAETPS